MRLYDFIYEGLLYGTRISSGSVDRYRFSKSKEGGGEDGYDSMSKALWIGDNVCAEMFALEIIYVT